MGNQKQKWTPEEEKALLNGIAKHGPGKWKNILKDPEFAPALAQRSNIDLKDKWRNLGVGGSAQGSKDRSRTPKVKSVEDAYLANAQNSIPSTSNAPNPPSDTVMEDASSGLQEAKNVPRWNEMVFEALNASNNANGLDLSAIISYIEQRSKIPPNFRRLLGSRLRRLVATNKLDKVNSNYIIKRDAGLAAKTPSPNAGLAVKMSLPNAGLAVKAPSQNAGLAVRTPSPKQKDIKPQTSKAPVLTSSVETVEQAATLAALAVTEAENKSFMATAAVKEVERVSRMAEDGDAILQLVKEIYEQCSRGETIFLA